MKRIKRINGEENMKKAFMVSLVICLILSGCRLDSGSSGIGPVGIGIIPDFPTDVSATAKDTYITVSWSLVPGADGYYVYRSTSEAESYNRVETTPSTSYTTSSLSQGTRYYFKVSAWNSAGESPQSSSASAITSPSTPSGLTATAASSTSIKLTWNSVSGATGYRVYRSTNDYSYSLVRTTSTRSFTNNGLSEDTTYYYRVSAYNSAGESSLSYSDWATTFAK